MSFETTIDIVRLVQTLVRIWLRLMPTPLREAPLCARLGLLTHAGVLRRHFDATEPGHDRSAYWLAIDGAAAILERLAIPHPERSAGSAVWRPFLAIVVAAAEEGDFVRARAAIKGVDWDFDPARGRGEHGQVTAEGKEGRGRAIPTL